MNTSLCKHLGNDNKFIKWLALKACIIYNIEVANATKIECWFMN